MKINKGIAYFVLFGPTTLFLFVAYLIAKRPWALLFLLVGAGILNTVSVTLLGWSERRWPANFAMDKPQAIGAAVKENALKVIGLTYLSGALGWMLGSGLYRLSGLPLLPPGEWIVAQVIGGLFIVDFMDYWAHRIQHRYEWLWAEHAIHHSVKEFSIFGAAKISWLDTPFVIFPGMLALGALGVGPVASAATLISWFALTTMLHANADLSLGPLDYVIQVPAVHHLHHEVGFDNALSFGGVFCVFDRLFGTGGFRGDFGKSVGLGPRRP